MIHITYARFGFFVVAMTVNDDHEVISAGGIGKIHASHRLLNKMGV